MNGANDLMIVLMLVFSVTLFKKLSVCHMTD